MPNFTVNVQDDNDDPVSYAKVMISIKTAYAPSYHDEDDTDGEGEVTFDVEKSCEIDVYVKGNLELEDILVGYEDVDVAVTI